MQDNALPPLPHPPVWGVGGMRCYIYRDNAWPPQHAHASRIRVGSQGTQPLSRTIVTRPSPGSQGPIVAHSALAWCGLAASRRCRFGDCRHCATAYRYATRLVTQAYTAQSLSRPKTRQSLLIQGHASASPRTYASPPP